MNKTFGKKPNTFRCRFFEQMYLHFRFRFQNIFYFVSNFSLITVIFFVFFIYLIKVMNHFLSIFYFENFFFVTLIYLNSS